MSRIFYRFARFYVHFLQLLKFFFCGDKILSSGDDKMRNTTYQIALCSILAAFAVALQFFGGAVFIGIYACPLLASLLLIAAREECRKSLAWGCFITGAFLGMLLCPDKECSALYLFLGWYPLVQPGINKISSRLVRIAVKGIIFVSCIAAMYALLIFVLGLADIAAEFLSDALWMNAMMAFMGIFIFIMFDKICVKFTRIYLAKRKNKKFLQ